jgi:hypothetical protein
MHTGRGRMVLLAILFAFAFANEAGAQDNDGCTNATLKGDYGFRVVTRGPGSSVGTVVGMKHFDGAGNLTQVDFGITDGVPTPDEVNPTTGAFQFRAGETGTYTVNPDCTGSMEIHLVPPSVPGGIIKIMFVLSNHGRAIHEVVAEFIPPGSTHPVLVTTYADDWKLGSDSDHE